MPSVDMRITVTPEERELLKTKAGKLTFAAWARKVFGLPPAKQGRPRKESE